MIELLLLFGLVLFGAAMTVALGVFAVKLVFKLLFLPIALGLFLLKAIAALALFVLLLVVAPVVVGVLLLVALPLLLCAGLVGLGALALGAA